MSCEPFFNFHFIVQLDCCSSRNGGGELDNGSPSPFSLFCTFCCLPPIPSGLNFCFFIFVFLDTYVFHKIQFSARTANL
jgi:hypothetical protein